MSVDFTEAELDAARADVASLDAEFPDEQPEPRRGDGGECSRCHKALKWPADDGLGPVCRRIIRAEQAAGGDES